MGILDNILSREGLEGLALGFNQMRLRPDPNLAANIAQRQQYRRKMQMDQANRQSAIDFFKDKPGGDRYIAALNAGGSGAGLIQNYIAAENARRAQAASRVPRSTVKIQMLSDILPAGTNVDPAMLNVPVPVTYQNGAITGIGRPIQGATPPKAPGQSQIVTEQQLFDMGAIGRGAAEKLGASPDALYQVTTQGGTVTDIEPYQATTAFDQNKTIELLTERANNGDILAQTALEEIEVAPDNAASIFGAYSRANQLRLRDKNKVMQTRPLGNGLVVSQMGDGSVTYRQNGELLVNPTDIENARKAADDAAIKATQSEAAAKAKGKFEGKKFGDINAAIAGLYSAIEIAGEKINVLYNHPGIANVTGRVNGLKGKLNATAEGAEFISLHEELAGQIFLSAFEKLKGGGPITDLEGQKAQKAASNLDRQLSPRDYQKALVTFYEGLRSNYERLIEERDNLAAGTNRSTLPPPIDFNANTNLEPDF